MKLIKNNILAISMILLTSCGTSYHQLAPEYNANTYIDSAIQSDSTILSIIDPYKTELKSKMDRVLAYAPMDLHKDGFNAPLCNLVADITLDYVDDLYEEQGKGDVDLALINHGGLRRTFTAGNLTVGNIYELMPFDNEVYVLKLKGETVKEMVDFLRKSHVGHPIAGIEATADGEIKVDGEVLELNKTYTIATTDYLYNGGDNMFFLQKAIAKDIINLKHRDLLLNYFETIDTVEVNTNPRIVK